MEKILIFLLTMAMLLSLTACGTTGSSSENPSESDSSESGQETSSAVSEAEPDREAGGEETGSNILVAYFSWADNAVLADDVDAVASPSVIPPGNVEQLAGWVQEETGGDLFSIQVTDPYPSDWDECLTRANQERGDNARPELVENVENLSQYDIVFLGYPNWWYSVPMALLSFLEQNDLSGKQVYLFCSHGTGGLARSVDIITEAAAGADISDNIFDCYEEEASSSQADIQAWVEELGADRAGGAESEQTIRQIQVRCGNDTVIYELNDSAAADSLYEQLPLTIEVEDYSTNEKIFYPPQALDTADAPLAEGGVGVLAYYAPWGDVVMFYDSFGTNSSLYELGRAVSGADRIHEMSGTITIDVAG